MLTVACNVSVCVLTVTQCLAVLPGVDPEGFLRGATCRAREPEPIAGVWGQSPWSGGQGAKPPPVKMKAF